jgi:hypothetical protein
LKYNGGGDSGYIESDFENGEPSPGAVEEWCYQQLEENFGGWEINEGSQGEFQFDFNEKTVILHTHTIPCWMKPIQYGKKNFKVIN